MGVPYSANVDIGFRTGATTEWRGNYLTDTSGDYNHIYSDTYTADSDGGVLDLTDINNLQIAVQRNASGPPQLQVTEVYVEVTYVP
jgi:bacillopeptidase F (M6 metalloprotease family)